MKKVSIFHIFHNWNGCTCRVCGKTRDKDMTGTVASVSFAGKCGAQGTTGTAKHALANVVSAEINGESGLSMRDMTGTVVSAAFADKCGTHGTTGNF